MVQESEGTLDAHGHLNVEFQVPQADETETSDYSYRLEAQVTDSARRTIDGAAKFHRYARHHSRQCRSGPLCLHKGDVAKVRVSTSDYEDILFRQRCSCSLSNGPGPRKQKN